MSKQSNLQIYDTLSRSQRDFIPLKAPFVGFYHCGPTVYWVQHIGNLRGMTMGDLIRRSLQYFDYQVKYVRNYTDVGHLTGDNIGDADTGEDRMEKGAKRENTTPDAIAAKYIRLFENDIAAINLLPADAKPQATAYVEQMQQMVQALIEKGFAYTTAKAVYFDVSKARDYTALSGQKLDLNLQGAGKGDVSDPEKLHPQDFALWFFKTGVHHNALQTWESPFVSAEVQNGRGFPGWHIECSAMAKAELAETIDIHMGGVEHISIHHTNEIAQSEGANGVKYVNYWLHNEHLLVNGKKMSKSEGTSYELADIIARGYDPLVLRYFFLNAHYRSKQNFTWEGLTAAKTALTKLRTHITNWQAGNLTLAGVSGEILAAWQVRFRQALANDFNIPEALAVTWELVKADEPAPNKYATILDFDRVLGLGLIKDANPKNNHSSEIIAEIEILISKRNQARGLKDFAAADKYRDELLQKYKVTIIDNPTGTTWVVNN